MVKRTHRHYDKMKKTALIGRILFEPQFGEEGWRLRHFAPDKLEIIKNFVRKANAKLDGHIPTRIGLSDDGFPAEIGVTQKRLYMDVTSIDYYGEKCFLAVLAHESAHNKYGDTANIYGALSRMQGAIDGYADVKNVCEESPESFAGLVIRRFGDAETFQKGMELAQIKMAATEAFFLKNGILPNTSASVLADRLLDDPLFQDGLNKIEELFPAQESATEKFFGKFCGETISSRRNLAERLDEGFKDYTTHLPSNKEDRERVVQSVVQIYQHYTPAMEKMTQNINFMVKSLYKATEHRADFEVAIKLGPEYANELTGFLKRQREVLLADVPEEEKGRAIDYMNARHPSPDEREAYVQRRVALLTPAPRGRPAP